MVLPTLLLLSGQEAKLSGPLEQPGSADVSLQSLPWIHRNLDLASLRPVLEGVNRGRKSAGDSARREETEPMESY